MWTRRTVRPILVATTDGWDLREEAPRRAWTAVLGPSAIAAYLRLREAAVQRRSLRRPRHLDGLLREGIIAIHQGRLLVPERVPPLTVTRLRRSTAGRLALDRPASQPPADARVLSRHDHEDDHPQR